MPHPAHEMTGQERKLPASTQPDSYSGWDKMTNLMCNEQHEKSAYCRWLQGLPSLIPHKFSGDSHVVAQQGQTQYEVCLHTIAGSAPGHIHPWCAFGVLLSPRPCLAVLGHCPSHYLGSICPPLGRLGQGF